MEMTSLYTSAGQKDDKEACQIAAFPPCSSATEVCSCVAENYVAKCPLSNSSAC